LLKARSRLEKRSDDVTASATAAAAAADDGDEALLMAARGVCRADGRSAKFEFIDDEKPARSRQSAPEFCFFDFWTDLVVGVSVFSRHWQSSGRVRRGRRSSRIRDAVSSASTLVVPLVACAVASQRTMASTHHADGLTHEELFAFAFGLTATAAFTIQYGIPRSHPCQSLCAIPHPPV
jgi:hypothetical protein